MAIAFVNKLGTQESGATTLTNTYAPTSGNLLIVVGSSWQAGGSGTLTLSDTRGNTIPSTTVQLSWNSVANITVWLIPNCIGGAGTLTLSSTRPAPDLNLDVYEYSGASATAALDGTPQTASSASLVTSLGTGNITLASATSMLFAGVWDYHAATTLTSSAGFTQRLNNQNTDQETSVGVDQLAPGAGTYSNTFTISASGTGALGVFIIGIQASTPLPALVQSTQNHNVANVSSLAQAYGSAVAAGDLLVGHVGTAGQAANTFTVSDSVNGAWTQAISSPGGANEAAAIFYFPNTAAGTPTVTVTMAGTAAPMFMVIEEFSGLKTSRVLDQTGTANGAAGAAPSIPTAGSTVWNTELVVGCCQLSTNTSVTITGTSGTTLDINNDGFLGAGYFVASSAGSQSVNFSQGSGNAISTGLLASFIGATSTAAIAPTNVYYRAAAQFVDEGVIQL